MAFIFQERDMMNVLVWNLLKLWVYPRGLRIILHKYNKSFEGWEMSFFRYSEESSMENPVHEEQHADTSKDWRTRSTPFSRQGVSQVAETSFQTELLFNALSTFFKENLRWYYLHPEYQENRFITHSHSIFYLSLTLQVFVHWLVFLFLIFSASPSQFYAMSVCSS